MQPYYRSEAIFSDKIQVRFLGICTDPEINNLNMKIDTAELAAQLAKVVDGKIQTDTPLAPFTSYKIGGPTSVWVAPNTETGVGHALEVIHENQAPLFILGRGSNILVSDKGWDGVTLYLGENLSGWSFQNRRANVLAGTLLMDLVCEVVKKGLSGLELMAGIPGSVGGALRMNAGAFGQEIEQVNVSVSGFNKNGTPFGAERHEINFNYRRVPELENVAITSAQFQFADEDSKALKRRMEDIIALRTSKQPLNYPSCGSIFKRPPGYYAGALIEESGLKGKRIGGAKISRKHAGFILNTDNAKAVEVYELIRLIETEVLDRFGVQLEREVKLIGKF